mgnify:CR=1 FL=1
MLDYTKHTLENGLDVIVHEDHRCPIVAVNLWYHVGSKNEQPGRTGLAHLFEHLMFEGSAHHDSSYFTPLQQVGADAREARDQLAAALRHRAAGDHDAARRVGAGAGIRRRGVAVAHDDAVGVDAEDRAGDLSQGGLQPLAHGRTTAEYIDGVPRMDRDARRLPRPGAAAFDETRDPGAEIAPVVAAPPLAPVGIVADGLQHPLEQGRTITVDLGRAALARFQIAVIGGQVLRIEQRRIRAAHIARRACRCIARHRQ